MQSKPLHVVVPATTANIGSGFDVLGLALSLYNEASYWPDEHTAFSEVTLTAEGEGVQEMPYDRRNVVLKAMEETARFLGKALPGGTIHLVNRIPFARGLGSSSAAIVCGVGLANLYFGKPLGKTDMLSLAAQIEGHPDNVAPAVLGGFVISMMDEHDVRGEKVAVAADWQAVVAIPDFELLTEKARAVLPQAYSRAYAVHNVSAVSFLLAAFFQKNPAYLRLGLEDRIHVPYRLALIPGADEVMARAEAAGAFGATISGSGPTMVAFVSREKAREVGRAMQGGFSSAGIQSRIEILDFDDQGLQEMKD